LDDLIKIKTTLQGDEAPMVYGVPESVNSGELVDTLVVKGL